MLFAVVFLFIYNICFSFIPGTIRTRLIISVIGLLWFLKNKIPRPGVKIISGILACIFIAIIFSLINRYFDYWFFQYLVLNLLYVFGAFFIAKTLVRNRNISINDFLNLILVCILVHNIISLAALGISPLQTAMYYVQKLSNLELVQGMMVSKTRAVGLGDGNFFHGGAISGIGLILSLYLGKTGRISSTKCILSFLIILVSGMFIARTTICGFAGLYLLFNGPARDRRRLLSITLKLFIVGAAAMALFVVYASQYMNLGWAFEFVFAYLEKGELETASSNQLLTMYVLPDTLTSLFIGDSRMLNPDGSYYMHSDAGFIRHLFYWGVLGSLAYWLLQMYICKVAYEASGRDRNIRNLLVTLLIYMLVLNIKGFIDINYMFYMIAAFFSVKAVRNENRHSYQ